MKVRFYKHIEDHLLKFAVIVATSGGKWVLCRHKERNTLECPGGHRKRREKILDTAKRELVEETGALDYHIEPICVYSVTGQNRVNPSGEEAFGMLYLADIKTFRKKLKSEMAEVLLMDNLPVQSDQWTYPEIQPKLIQEVLYREYCG